ncbi:extracellular solute-binding protein [Antarcticimicrobium luteum]|uniref:Putrescine-binding periplasmic protein n=1 Tax=Antarcticimicrobium luteum TaxID=2547397 RepID=A0A4R5VFQ5_9RHOB|nr:extracellular solute-binding protein [Antarcticimicrobium luteum]TDK51395.1 extracellular solute-binding protein [Antarcticimicrobium luteum]
MKQTRISLLALGIVALSGGGALAEGDVALYNWGEYIEPEILIRFEAETGIHVTMDTYDSNEAMLASLKAGKLGQYDLAIPGDYMVDIMRNEGMLDTFEPSDLTNFGNILPQYIDVPFDPGRHSTIPYLTGTTSFAVDRNKFKGDINSLALLFNPPEELKGKINVLDAQNDVLALASMYLGIPQCTSDRDQLRALNDMLQNAKKDWASFGSDNSREVLVSGDVTLSMTWSGYSARARDEGANVEWAYPKEGYIMWMDNVVLLKDAPNRENALKFMNFLLEPEIGAANTNYAKYAPVLKGEKPFLDEKIANAPESNPPADHPGTFVQSCSEEVQVVYDKIWANLKK